MTELLMRPDLGKRAYRLKCRFTVNAFPSPSLLEKQKFKVAEMFVTDMAKQGFAYLDKHGFRMTGPYPQIKTVILPKRHQQARWNASSRALLPGLTSGRIPGRLNDPGYVTTVNKMNEMDAWDFELSGVFVHDTILVETPDAHEEKGILKSR